MRRGSAARGLSTVVEGTPGFEHLETIVGKVRALGWHVVVHVNRADELTALAPRLIATGCPLLIDHIARVRREEGLASGGFQTLLQLLGGGNCWVKISGQHRMSAQGYPWADMRPLVRGVVDARPDRVLWGSDWPHPNQYNEMQNDGACWTRLRIGCRRRNCAGRFWWRTRRCFTSLIEREAPPLGGQRLISPVNH